MDSLNLFFFNMVVWKGSASNYSNQVVPKDMVYDHSSGAVCILLYVSLPTVSELFAMVPEVGRERSVFFS